MIPKELFLKMYLLNLLKFILLGTLEICVESFWNTKKAWSPILQE